jgi:hypothetical protein
MSNTEMNGSMTYLDKEPNILGLQEGFSTTINNLSGYFDSCSQAYDDRRNRWQGKSDDHRKHGADAFPWDGASDVEAHVIDERINRLVSIFVASLARANVRAFPVENGDIARSKLVSGFLKWMVSSGYIDRFREEMELGANYMLERGLLITYVGWQKEDRRVTQEITLEQVQRMDSSVAEAIKGGEADDELVALLQNVFDGVTAKQAKKSIKELRKDFSTKLPLKKRKVDAPQIKTLSPDGEFFFPNYVSDPQKAPYCFWRTYYTAQELKNKVGTEGWNEDFVDYLIENYKGVNVESVDGSTYENQSIHTVNTDSQSDDLIEICYGYQRLISQEDNAEGIYCTVFHRDFSGDDGDNIQPYAKFELMNGYDDYPVVVTKLSDDSKQLYEVQTVSHLIRGIQNQVKVERDSRIDRNSMATLPPITHPLGQRPTDWGPGRFVPERRKGDIGFAPAPQFNAGSLEIENTLLELADKLTGLDESNVGRVRQQFLVDKFLSHTAKVIRMAFKCFQRFGPDEVFFRVTGVPDPQTMSKGDPDEDFDIMINFDVLNTDPETVEYKLRQFVQLNQLNVNGRMNVDNLLDIAAASIDPVMADSIIEPIENSQKQIVDDVNSDLVKIFSGIESNARPAGAQIAMGVIQRYAQQPDIAQRLESDEGFKARMEKYAGQYTFQMQQMQNAETGRRGTAPAQMGGMQL